ncbi:MAG TPA: Amuc_1100 family pilus-like protein [Kiritimatiellia bacterium]|nr:Amuc_1100 family pilus-like protein [Kiritimatiellia bacterium]
MNWRKHMVLLVGGGIALILLIVALVFLFRARGNFERKNDELAQSLRKLESLTRRNPFPSPANIQVLEANLAAIRDAAGDLQETLAKGQVSPDPIEAAQFAPLLEQSSKRLVARAGELGITMPDRFSLGLDRYAAGELPSRQAIPRLVTQLKTMEALCGILFQARIHTLMGIEREPFELAAQPEQEEFTGMRRRATVQEPTVSQRAAIVPKSAENPLYEVERVTITVLARDAAVWDVLNLMASSPLVASVVDVQLVNTLADQLGKAQPVAAIEADKAPAGVPLRYPTHEERIVAGRELVRATILVDVYRFVQDIKEDAP